MPEKYVHLKTTQLIFYLLKVVIKQLRADLKTTQLIFYLSLYNKELIENLFKNYSVNILL